MVLNNIRDVIAEVCDSVLLFDNPSFDNSIIGVSTNDNLREKTSCCNGTKRVFDKRFGEWYSCPRCTGHIDKLDSNGNVLEVVELKNNTFSEKVVDTTKKFSFDDLFN